MLTPYVQFSKKNRKLIVLIFGSEVVKFKIMKLIFY